LRDTEAGILFNEHIAQDGPVVFPHACRLGAEGVVSKKVDGTYRSGACRVWIKVRNPASIAVQRERSEMWNRRPPAVASGEAMTGRKGEIVRGDLSPAMLECRLAEADEKGTKRDETAICVPWHFCNNDAYRAGVCHR
jgi:hypothetical protein